MSERIFYANQQVMIRGGDDVSTFGTGDEVHGVQSVGMTTNFNLTQVFELGQLALYENSEDLPDVEVTISKVLDGYPLVWIMATQDATSAPTLIGRSNAQSFVGISIFEDTAVADGTPLSKVQCSGMFASSLSYNFPLEDPFTEEVTLVGNNKVWSNAPSYGSTIGPSVTGVTFTADGKFDANTADTPSSAAGVNRRQHLQLSHANTYDKTRLPLEVAGVDVNGYLDLTAAGRARLSSITVSTDLGRENLLELGRRGPYHRFVTFPTEVTCDIEVTSISGDMVSATEDGIYATGTDSCLSAGNLANRTIRIATCEGTRLYLGTQNRLASTSFGGGDAGGGNATVTYSYSNFNDLTVLHPSGVSASGNLWWTNRATYLE